MPSCRRFLSHALIAIPLLIFAASAHGEGLPARYDLRSVSTLGSTVAWVSSIQNQGTAEDCWTFASATAMDSSLIKSGYLSTSSAPPAPEVSSWHLSTANGNANQLNPEKAFSSDSNWGGWEFMALGYATRGSGLWTIPGNHDPTKEVTTFSGGPVSNAANPKNVFPAVISTWTLPDKDFVPNPITPLLPPVNQPTAWRVTQVSVLDQGFSTNVALPTSTGAVSIGGTDFATYSFTQGAADLQVQAVKSAVLANGAVTTSMNALPYPSDPFYAVANPVGSTAMYTMEYVNPFAAPAFLDHEVTIIGWDDSKQINVGGTTTTGAWLVQNSWGTNFYNNTPANYTDGTFWASYNDAVIGRVGVSSYQLAPMTGWSQTVLQNELGPMVYAADFQVISGTSTADWVGMPTGMATVQAGDVMSILTPESDSLLSGLGLATQKGGVSVNVKIHEWNPLLNSFGQILETATFTNDSVGFFLGTLPSTVLLHAGQSYAVELDYGVDNAAPITIGGSGINGYLTVTPGLSYYRDGASWVDMNTLAFTSNSGPNAQGGILFLKGYLSSVPEIDPAGMGNAMAIGGAALALLERRARRRCRVA